MFSVVVPTYGRPQFLSEALESVRSQRLEDWECIVVDDASPDPVTVPDDPRVRVVRRSVNGGAAAARNTGIEEATGEVVCFLDDDDLYTPERLELAAEGLERAPITVCWSRWLNGPEEPQRILEGNVHKIIAEAITPHLGVTAVKRDVLPHFNERFRTVQDIEWWIRATETLPVATVPKFGYLVRRHPGDRTGYGAEQRINDSHLLMQTHRDYFAATPRARAFRWRRIGLMSRKIGDTATARRAFLRALRTRPDPRDAKHLLTSLRR